MKNDNAQATHHRGSSPPFQDPEQDLHEWLDWLKSIGQRDEKALEIQIAKQAEVKRHNPPT
jgi:hypothetical protein